MHRHWCFVVATAILCACSHTEASDNDYQPADLIAGYQYNRSRFPRPRVVLRRGIDFRNGTKSVIIEDYWTDWQKCLVRMREVSDPGQEYVVPGSEISPESLVSGHPSTRVFSRRSGVTGEFRLWHGVDCDGVGNGRVGTGPISGALVQFAFPPLAAPDTSWDNPSTWHSIDVFFAKPESEMKVLGVRQVDGVETVVVEHMVREPAAEFLQKQVEGVLEVGDVTTAWIDPQRGYLPLRLVKSAAFILDGRRIEHRSADALLDPNGQKDANLVVRVTRIDLCEGGGFYPFEGSRAQRGKDPDYDGPFNTVAEALEGKVRGVPVVDYTREHWQVEYLEPDVGISEETLALRFPEGTQYFDEVRSRGMIEGVSEEELDRVLGEEQGQVVDEEVKPAWRWRGTVIAVNLVFLVALLALFYWRWRRKR
jgi:hypothetical protein